MEPEVDETDKASDVAETQRTPTEQPAFTPPFASEGLERVRDSHC